MSDLRGVAEVFTLSSTLRETAAMALSTRKGVYAEFLSGMPPFCKVQARLRGHLEGVDVAAERPA